MICMSYCNVFERKVTNILQKNGFNSNSIRFCIRSKRPQSTIYNNSNKHERMSRKITRSLDETINVIKFISKDIKEKMRTRMYLYIVFTFNNDSN